MKETYWGYWIILLGIFVVGVMLLVNNISTTNTQDYYSIKEVTQASMVDALDFSYYRLYGDIKMSEQKFVENFIRRFSENINLTNTYEISFYDLYEVPPKVSVEIQTKSGVFTVGNSRNDAYDIVSRMDAILEIGAKGTTPSGNKTNPGRTCVFDITANLYRFFLGETVDGKNIRNTRYNGGEYSDLKNQSDFSTFRSAFVKKYQDKLSSASSFAQMSQSNADIREWIDYGWITIH